MKQDTRKLLVDIATAIGVAAPLAVSGGQPTAAMAALSAAWPSVTAFFDKVLNKTDNSITLLRWKILSQAFIYGVTKVLADERVGRHPQKAELEALVDSLLNRAAIIASTNSTYLTQEVLYSPLKAPFIRDASKRIYAELSFFNVRMTVAECRSLFERPILDGLAQLRDADVEAFKKFEDSVTGPFIHESEKRNALARHHESIIRAFCVTPIFGQEATGITLSDLYVRQRCLWNTKERRPREVIADTGAAEADNADFNGGRVDDKDKWDYPIHLGDLHEELQDWLNKKNRADNLRFVAGGPGSGKSTFARAFAIETLDQNYYDVLFVPLQEIEATGTFKSRIEALFRDRTDLGLDRVANPLDWLGQRESDGSTPYKPLLLICDGLDEIAPPDSPEAASVTSEFIHVLRTWLDNRNSGGFYVSALVLGRTISAQEAFAKASVDHTALLKVGGLLPITRSHEWQDASSKHDTKSLAEIDQRSLFWLNWCQANPEISTELPEALEGNTEAARALEELTTEPLLLYLLIWTRYLGDRWEEAADNRNNVYQEIFHQIYDRRWGQTAPVLTNRNIEGGGHAGTAEISYPTFLLLQESLGLAAWPSGSRTIDLSFFSSLIQTFLHEDILEDLPKNHIELLKSIALQSYTRSLGGSDAGYEFVHKSLGEYLIGRALSTWLEAGLLHVKDKTTDPKCARAAEHFSKLVWIAPLTNEIHRFFKDEIRARIKTPYEARLVLKQMVPLMDWMIAQGVPVHRAFGPEINFNRIAVGEKRALNFYWAALQAVSSIAYPMNKFSNTEDPDGWVCGPLKINWGTRYGFTTFLSRITAHDIIIESKRAPTFDYLLLERQSLAEENFDLSLMEFFDDTLMENWYSLSMRGALLHDGEIFGSSFWKADLSKTTIASTSVERVKFTSVQFDQTTFDGCSLDSSEFLACTGIATSFQGCDLSSTVVSNCTFLAANFSNSYSGAISRGPIIEALIIKKSQLSDSDFTAAKFAGAIIHDCAFDNVILDGADFRHSVLIDTNLANIKSSIGFRSPNKSRIIDTRLKEGSGHASRALLLDLGGSQISVLSIT